MSKDCKTVHRLWIDEATGERPSKSDQAFISAHLDQCEACQTEARLADAININEPDGPPPFTTDEIARRRFIDETLSKSSVKGARTTSGGRLGATRILFAVAALVAIAIGAVLWQWSDPQRSETAIAERAQSGKNAADPAATPTGQLLLSSRDIHSGSAIIEAGASLRIGQRLQTDHGRAVVSLNGDVILFLDRNTEIKIVELSEKSTTIRLNRGYLLTSVTPRRTGPVVSVTTRAGRVSVTGTVFSVSDNADEVRVGVVSGKVRLEDDGLEPRRLEVSSSAALGSIGSSALSREEETAARELLRIVDLLTPSREASSFHIQSVPAGATVSVDGLVLGQTPLLASVRAGHRQLQLTLSGYANVRELLELGPQTDISRVYDLKRSPSENLVAERSTTTATGQPKPSAQLAQKCASQLLVEAQSYRSMRRWSQAAAAYRLLTERYPKSVDAQTSLISLGSIQLEHLGRPAAALKSFEQYLRRYRSGTLAPEAAFGRIRALQSLGRRDEEIRALRVFLSDFPNAVQANIVKNRLGEVNGKNR